jgi:uncharacterized protein YodC (DUF2158 family)
MAKQEFRIGDIVYLKSGGPAMTVEDILTRIPESDTRLRCTWFSGGEASDGEFNPLTLVREKPEA